MKALLFILFILLGGWGYMLWHENAPLSQQHLDRLINRCVQTSPVRDNFCECYYTRAGKEMSRRDLANAMDSDQSKRNIKEAGIAKKYVPYCIRESRVFYNQCAYDASKKNMPASMASTFCNCLSDSMEAQLDPMMSEIEQKVLQSSMTADLASRQTWQQYYFRSWTTCAGSLKR